MARPRAEDFEEKRDAILQGAARAFAEQGVMRASMAQVAAALGVSKALLYHYYDGKEALIFAIIEAHLEALDRAVAQADAAAIAPRERLRALIAAVLERYRHSDAEHKVQLNGMEALDEARREAIRAIERRIVRRFAATIVEINPALDDGRLTPVTMSIFGVMNWAYMWFREGGAITRADYAALVATLMLDGLNGVR